MTILSGTYSPRFVGGLISLVRSLSFRRKKSYFHRLHIVLPDSMIKIIILALRWFCSMVCSFVNSSNLCVAIEAVVVKPSTYLFSFAAWSLSFYPQTILNFRRKSVIGLHFDFLYLNIIGWTAYSLYNGVFFWSGKVQNEYFNEHPEATVIPVHLNDVVFALHGFVLTSIQIVQCFIYDRGTQYITFFALVTGIPCWFFIIISIELAFADVITFFRMIKWISFAKLFVTFLKYCPQAYFNFKRKSTVGWSIHNILLDLTGGILSLMQLGIDCRISGNLKPVVGDPVKFGLSIISIGFDILFIMQHYVFYAKPKEEDTYAEYDSDDGIPEESSLISGQNIQIKDPSFHSDSLSA